MAEQDLSSLWGSPEAQKEPKPSEKPKPEPGTGELKEEILPETPEKVEEVVEATVVTEEGEKGFGQKLDELLSELNLTRKKLFMFAVGIVVTLFIVFFGIRWVIGFFQKEEIIEEVERKVPSVADEPLEASLFLGKPLLFEPEFFPKTGLEFSLFLGKPEALQRDLISNAIVLLQRIKNAFATDVNEMLAKVTDRRGVLGNHVLLLNGLVSEAETFMTQMESELLKLRPEVERLSSERLVEEQEFFTKLEALDPQATQDLSEFVAESKTFIELRSKFRALSEIHSRYRVALPRLQARIRDIELNEEALVKGIVIYDVRGSDLELIVPVEAGVQVPAREGTGALGAPIDAVIHPLLRDQKDYIHSGF